MARVAILVAVVAGCGPIPAAERGAALFTSPAFSPGPTNVFACATCHSVRDGGDPDRRPAGYTMWGAAARPTWWGGEHRVLLDAVNQCFVEFMRGEPLTEAHVDGRALRTYLGTLAPSPSPALPLTVVKDIVDLPAGDAAWGATAWRAACANCHGDPHTGKGRLGPRVTILPEETQKSFPGMARLVTIEKVRHGRFFAIGGNMPLFSVEALTDGELSDVLAFLGL
jgi:thiosulfate dehydrogenase